VVFGSKLGSKPLNWLNFTLDSFLDPFLSPTNKNSNNLTTQPFLCLHKNPIPIFDCHSLNFSKSFFHRKLFVCLIKRCQRKPHLIVCEIKAENPFANHSFSN
jgi:hypothetical protein